MRQLTTVLCALACFAIVGGSVSSGRTFARDNDSDSKSGKTSASSSSELPKCMEKLNLTDDQKSKAKEISQKYQTKIDQAWKQFSDKYMETVRTEVALMAAVEDHLNDSQRESIRSGRRKHAHAENRSERRDSSSAQETEKQTEKQTDKSSATSNDKKLSQSNQGKTNDLNQGTAKAPNRGSNDSAVVIDEVDEYVFPNGITLTIEQEAIADRISSKYVRHLRQLHREIRSIHDRLIALEADKLVELEKLLTTEQATQLRENRQSPSGDHAVTSKSSGKNGETND